MVSCTRFFFMYKFLAPNTAQLYSIQETCMHVTRMVGCLSLPLFSFCCVCVVDNVLYKVNMVCLLIYFLSYLSYSSKNSVPMEWSTKSIEKVICFVQERPFLFGVSSAELAWTCTKIWCKKLAQETCASFLQVSWLCVTAITLLACHDYWIRWCKQRTSFQDQDQDFSRIIKCLHVLMSFAEF